MSTEKSTLVLVFTKNYATKSKVRYDEEPGEEEYSNKGPAIGYLYPYIEAIELIGTPDRIRVTIEPI
ncbi:MAG: hypothetical protein PHZ19_08875 [Candidatus Thermoplasmatota archaeon]|nr:hypothetical protein [Candidatus Thermoplasmatota archaeon]